MSPASIRTGATTGNSGMIAWLNSKCMSLISIVWKIGFALGLRDLQAARLPISSWIVQRV